MIYPDPATPWEGLVRAATDRKIGECVQKAKEVESENRVLRSVVSDLQHQLDQRDKSIAAHKGWETRRRKEQAKGLRANS